MIFPLEGYEVLTVERAKGLSWRDEVMYFPDGHATSVRFSVLSVALVDSSMVRKPSRWRVNGKPKTWKRSPGRVKVPVKYGLYSHGYITEDNVSDFYVEVA